MDRTRDCIPATVHGRRQKARQFSEAAEVVSAFADDAGDVADAYVTLLVHAGIAASDVICCVRLGEHAVGENHHEAVALLAKVNKARANDLRTLLDRKTKAGYSHTPVSREDRLKVERACQRLMEAMAHLD